MKIKKIILMLFMGSIGLLSVSGCGSNTVDPVQFTDPPFPALNSIQLNNVFSSLIAPGYTSTTPYWTFNNLSGSYVAPAAGIVSDIGVTTVNGVQSTYIVLLHSGRLATRISGLQTVSPQVGNSVVSGQVIATFVSGLPGNSYYATFQVLVDGTPVCPLSYMSTQFRQNFTSFGFPPCQ